MKAILVFHVLTILLIETVNTQSLCFATNCTTYVSPPHQVLFGVAINSVDSLDINKPTVRFDSYVWIKWKRCSQVNGTVFRPDLTIRLQNVFQRVDLLISPSIQEPVCDADSTGQYAYMSWRIEGEFNQKMSFRSYPIDKNNLWLEFEDSFYSTDDLIYVSDNQSTMNPSIDLPSWGISSNRSSPMMESRIIHYSTNFGSNVATHSNQDYSNIRFGIQISRGWRLYVFKILPPVVITIIISILVFIMDIDDTDVRIATITGTLLALIFLQLSFVDNLPNNLDYVTLMDVVFDISYFLMLSLIIDCIFIHQRYRHLLFRYKLDEQYALRKGQALQDAHDRSIEKERHRLAASRWVSKNIHKPFGRHRIKGLYHIKEKPEIPAVPPPVNSPSFSPSMNSDNNHVLSPSSYSSKEIQSKTASQIFHRQKSEKQLKTINETAEELKTEKQKAKFKKDLRKIEKIWVGTSLLLAIAAFLAACFVAAFT